MYTESTKAFQTSIVNDIDKSATLNYLEAKKGSFEKKNIFLDYNLATPHPDTFGNKIEQPTLKINILRKQTRLKNQTFRLSYPHVGRLLFWPEMAAVTLG